jgi:hypothetical protein
MGQSGHGTVSIFDTDPGVNWFINSDPNTPAPKIRLPLTYVHIANQTNRHFAGRPKRMLVVQDGGANDTYDNGTAIQLSSNYGAFIFTVWDPGVVPVGS